MRPAQWALRAPPIAAATSASSASCHLVLARIIADDGREDVGLRVKPGGRRARRREPRLPVVAPGRDHARVVVVVVGLERRTTLLGVRSKAVVLSGPASSRRKRRPSIFSVATSVRRR